MPSPKGCKEGRARMLDQLERQEVEEQHLQPRGVAPPAFPEEDDQRQRRRMVIALILLLVALGLVLVKDRDFWFPSTDTTAEDTEAIEDSTPIGTVEAASSTAPAADTIPSAPAPAPALRRRERVTVPKPAEEAAPVAAPVTTARAVLPPLRVEVEAGGRSQFLKPGAPSVKVVMQPGTVVSQPEPPEMASVGNAPLTNAGERIQMTSDARQVLSRSVKPEYPLLARQMKVQGRVDLAATIGTDGGIRVLNVTAGPTILADAAREAVKQWRFKPHMEGGQPVETQVPISVNFTISAH
jgi:TonB family protein